MRVVIFLGKLDNYRGETGYLALDRAGFSAHSGCIACVMSGAIAVSGMPTSIRSADVSKPHKDWATAVPVTSDSTTSAQP